MVPQVFCPSTSASVATPNKDTNPPIATPIEAALVQSNSYPTSFLQQSFSHQIQLDKTFGKLSVSYTPTETILNQRTWCQSIECQTQTNPADLAQLFVQQIRALLSPDKLNVKVEYELEDGATMVHLCKYVIRKKRKYPAFGEEDDEDTP